MVTPIRIQRSRQHKQVSQNGLPIVYVGRPSKFGNPFKLIGDMIFVDASHRRKILDPYVLYYQDGDYTQEDVVKLFRDMMMDLNSHEVEPEIKKRFEAMRDTVKDLKGKNLSCWCKIGEPCHANILLELANEL